MLSSIHIIGVVGRIPWGEGKPYRLLSMVAWLDGHLGTIFFFAIRPPNRGLRHPKWKLGKIAIIFYCAGADRAEICVGDTRRIEETKEPPVFSFNSRFGRELRNLRIL